MLEKLVLDAANCCPCIILLILSSCCYILFIWKIILNSHENSGFLSVKMIVGTGATDI